MARARFEHLDSYRVDREWRRYEGTAQRDLFRELRIRFLNRNRAPGPWAIDIGSGPGRFLPYLGAESCQRVALDLSLDMLQSIDPSRVPGVHRVRGDGVTPPFARETFSNVAVLGNSLGFAGREAGRLLESSEEITAPRGHLLLEVVVAPGERSRYLDRLSSSTLVRLLRSPVGPTVLRVDSEGYAPEPARKAEGGEFRRFDPTELVSDLQSRGWGVREILAVAPGLGSSPAALEAVRADGKAWGHLVDLEERLGKDPKRWGSAAALLLALARTGTAARTIK